jgi:DNA-binding NtrC family response regulator
MARTDATLTLPADYAPKTPLGVLLRVLNAPANPAVFALHGGSCRVGAGSEVDLVIEDETVSRQHLTVELVPEGVSVVDEGSRNGTFYREQRLRSAVLAPGSRIFLGRVELAIDLDTRALRDGARGAATGYGGLIGSSEAMRSLFAMLRRLEGSLLGVLVSGESGTGKELVARAIHDHSSVSAGPYVAVNCGVLDRSLVRSELFGHVRGAFTGASEAHVGVFEQANGGTLFLDEVGELPVDVQPMLLRALELGKITRLGDSRERSVNVRVISATHRALEQLVHEGAFREDLFYRLVVVAIHVPPLRERPEDIPVLASHFAEQSGSSPIAAETIARWMQRTWPGNVRELRNAVGSYIALGGFECQPRVPRARPADLDDALKRFIDVERPYAKLKEDLVERFIQVYLEHLLRQTQDNQSEAARLSGIERSHLNRMLKRARPK